MTNEDMLLADLAKKARKIIEETDQTSSPDYRIVHVKLLELLLAGFEDQLRARRFARAA